jgi:hypothetical protein
MALRIVVGYSVGVFDLYSAKEHVVWLVYVVHILMSQ